MKYTIDDLDELYNTRARAEFQQGLVKSDYDQKIYKLQVEKTAKMDEFEKDLKEIDEIIEMTLGDNDEITTPAGKFTRKAHDPRKANSYDVNVKSNKDTIELLEHNNLLSAAVKVETKETKSVNKTPIKELLASGVMTVSNDGHLVDENGEILEIEASLKPVSIKFKAKK